jgi:hypothetical protein
MLRIQRTYLDSRHVGFLALNSSTSPMVIYELIPCQLYAYDGEWTTENVCGSDVVDGDRIQSW